MNIFKIHFNLNWLCVALLQERMRDVERAMFSYKYRPPPPCESKHGRQRRSTGKYVISYSPTLKVNILPSALRSFKLSLPFMFPR